MTPGMAVSSHMRTTNRPRLRKSQGLLRQIDFCKVADLPRSRSDSRESAGRNPRIAASPKICARRSHHFRGEINVAKAATLEDSSGKGRQQTCPHSSHFENNFVAEMWSFSEEGSHLRLIDCCITLLWAREQNRRRRPARKAVDPDANRVFTRLTCLQVPEKVQGYQPLLK